MVVVVVTVVTVVRREGWEGGGRSLPARAECGLQGAIVCRVQGGEPAGQCDPAGVKTRAAGAKIRAATHGRGARLHGSYVNRVEQLVVVVRLGRAHVPGQGEVRVRAGLGHGLGQGWGR